MTGKRLIEGAFDVMPISKQLQGSNKEVTILIPKDEAEECAKPVNTIYSPRVVGIVNNFMDEA